MTAQGKTTGVRSQEVVQDDAWKEERQRLRAFEGMTDPSSLRRLDALGLREGWSCLEVGCGTGSITRWMSHRVVPGGRVLALDVDTRFVADAAGPALEVLQQDLATAPLPQKVFDIVHVRRLLQPRLQLEPVMERLVSALKPGGWLLLEEMETFSLAQNEPGPFRQMVEVLHTLERPAAAASPPVRGLPGTLQRMGLRSVSAEGELLVFSGGSPAAEYHQHLATRLWREGEHLRMLTRKQYEQCLEKLNEPSAWFYGPTLFSVRGQRPFR
jgi:SAM-dependent methyltransferase